MLRLASLFCDSAVIQTGKTIPVWGWSEPSSLIQICLGKYVRMVYSSPEGKFLIRFPAFSRGCKLKMCVENKNTGECIHIRNLVAGEVWLASGQSNMEFKLSSLAASEEINFDSRIRFFRVDKSARVGGRETVAGKWVIPSADNKGDISAVGYFFAAKLARQLDTPVGIIDTSWAGTVAEAWSPRFALTCNPRFQERLAAYEASVYRECYWDDECSNVNVCEEGYNRKFAEKQFECPENKGLREGWTKADADVSGWKIMNLPGSWRLGGEDYNGIFWFRKEVNLSDVADRSGWTLSLGEIDKQDITYFNGEEIGRTGNGFDNSGWNVKRLYPIPGELLREGKNIISVRVFSFIFGGGFIGMPDDMALISPRGDRIALHGKWHYTVEQNFGKVTCSTGNGFTGQPHILFDNMIRPLIPYAIHGVIFYQGETNEREPNLYYGLLSYLIADWRRQWEDDFPFLQVQLPAFRNPGQYREQDIWPQIREAQLKAAEATGNLLAVTYDCGDEKELHPKDKRPIGERLADLALGNTVPVVLKSYSVSGGRAILLFSDEIISTSGKTLFFTSGADGKFLPADMEIRGRTVHLRAMNQEKIEAIRYAWADMPRGAILKSKDGIPVTPFRTDDWDLPVIAPDTSGETDFFTVFPRKRSSNRRNS